MLVDQDTIPTSDELVARLAIDLPLSAAVMHGVASWQLEPGSAPHRENPALPRFGIDLTGTPFVDPAAILDSIGFWGSAPLDLEWVDYSHFRLSASEVAAALSGDNAKVAAGWCRSLCRWRWQVNLPADGRSDSQARSSNPATTSGRTSSRSPAIPIARMIRMGSQQPSVG